MSLLWLAAFSSVWPSILALLAILLLLSGIDDLVPLIICLGHRIANRRAAADPSLGEFLKQERRIAIFVPCWKESGVIGNMIRHNLAAICYRNFDFFLGAYPNDESTMAAAGKLAESYRNVHVAACPHPGPTSKADCLNWIYQRMLLYEEEHAVSFDTVLLHDAEDLIHPEALGLINRMRATYAMVQIPVLPLATPVQEFTHGIYCDEFAEYQTIDMPARQFSRSFIPSNGVGTGFARGILDELARERGNRVFDPASLTEDYEIGVHVHECGYEQLFAPLRHDDRGWVATREYFPRRVRSAIKQRTRWVMGIALQCWERSGWRGSWRTRYWFWRDRKGLLTNPLTLLTNLLFTLGLTDLIASAATHRPWAFAVSNPKIIALCLMTLVLQCLRLGIRMVCVERIFGLVFALGVPLRAFHANLVNCLASLGAVWRYANARLRGQPLVWLKTEHAYPSRDALLLHRRELTDVLVSSGFISEEMQLRIQQEMPADADLADFLLTNSIISDEDLCKAMSLQSGVPSAHVNPRRVKARVARSLPAHVEERFGIVPFGLQDGRLFVAGARVPPSSLFEELQAFTRLHIEFQLVTRQNYEELRQLL
ncbi:MAG: glycosyl transferase family protein [Bryobacteraceae bacterium]